MHIYTAYPQRQKCVSVGSISLLHLLKQKLNDRLDTHTVFTFTCSTVIKTFKMFSCRITFFFQVRNLEFIGVMRIRQNNHTQYSKTFKND